MSDIKTLLEQAVAEEEFAPPGAGLYAAAADRARRRTRARVATATAAVTVLAGGGVAGARLLRDPAPAPVAAIAADRAPACVRAQLADANALVRTRRYSAVVVDIPGQKVLLTQGISSGYGWDRARVVRVVHDLPGLTPSGSFRMWEGVTPEANPEPGRHLLFLFLDNSPKAPGGRYGPPIWGFVWQPQFPVTGDDVVVRCADGTAARVPWVTAATTWLAPSAPRAPEPSAPGGSTTAATGRPAS